ncbi:Rab GTPase [Tieghemostelium lacteum]|uniref:Rab GTPase n=1 Tax=Tieghemostelium lacteum TaxID=361077 RepID=A0A151Z5Z6_TIELA|nr:Rab GTPase [Tieghemostelium lacteum]|eukprot:KYQ89382.1 Rab GTPase [Tieghemostelium lacteum]
MSSPLKLDAKIVLLGYTFSGKTCIVKRLIDNAFDDTIPTVGGAFSLKRSTFNNIDGNQKNITVTLMLWDTAGTERYQSVNRSYYRRANAAVVCYDLTNEESWDKVRFWVDELNQNEPDIDIYIVGNKLDLIKEGAKRAVSQEKVQEFAEKTHASVYETSAKTGENIEPLFETISLNLIKKYPNGLTSTNSNSLTLKSKSDKGSGTGKKKCCE